MRQTRAGWRHRVTTDRASWARELQTEGRNACVRPEMDDGERKTPGHDEGARPGLVRGSGGVPLRWGGSPAHVAIGTREILERAVARIFPESRSPEQSRSASGCKALPCVARSRATELVTSTDPAER